ncbi:hypothetical protein CASFOL_025322 [Castilleja foliolosa]|uniref:RING-type domain-containing protein n=1 Tax=Castilleja foliolosa TaxID=1961234 RepID=A0ABD3CQT0_9LAMI
MAVEATHTNLNHFTPQIVQHRDLMNQQILFPDLPLSATLPAGNNPSYEAVPVCCDSLHSGLTYSTNNYTRPVASRKRPVDQLYPAAYNNISLFHQQQLDIDTIISQHTKKIKLELQEMQKHETKLLLAAIGQGAMSKLKEKEDQIQRIHKLNFVLQQKVKSIYAENQLWRDLAQTNEATANSLRVNLEQALSRVGNERRAEVEDDVESCCGSTEEDRDTSVCYSDRRCRVCGERESCVLMLPCRHLCLCDVCGSGSHKVQACPVCNSSMKATLHVNMSMP